MKRAERPGPDWDIAALAEALLDADQEWAVAAARALGERGDSVARAALREALEQNLGRYDRRALTAELVCALGRLEDRAAEALLVEALRSSFYHIQAEALQALERIEPGGGALEQLRRLVEQDGPTEVKREAVRGLGRTRDPRALDHLAGVLEPDREPAVKQEAVAVLGDSECAEAATALMDFYHQEADRVLRQAVIDALARIASVDSVDFLLGLLEDPDAHIRASAAEALGLTRNPLAKLPLEHALTDADADERVRYSAARALGLIVYLPLAESEPEATGD